MAATASHHCEDHRKFACEVGYENHSAERWECRNVSVFDSQASAINALGAPPIRRVLSMQLSTMRRL